MGHDTPNNSREFHLVCLRAVTRSLAARRDRGRLLPVREVDRVFRRWQAQEDFSGRRRPRYNLRRIQNTGRKLGRRYITSYQQVLAVQVSMGGQISKLCRPCNGHIAGMVGLPISSFVQNGMLMCRRLKRD